MSKKVKILIGIVIIFIMVIFLNFNNIYISKEKYDLETKLNILNTDAIKSQKNLENNGFKVGAEIQLGEYVMYSLDYIYKNKIDCYIYRTDWNSFDISFMPIEGTGSFLDLKLDGNDYTIIDDARNENNGNKNNYSDESIKKVTDYFSNVIEKTYKEYIDDTYANPVVGREHFLDLMLHNFFYLHGIDFTIDKEKS